jgi:uncharacterized membrane protein
MTIRAPRPSVQEPLGRFGSELAILPTSPMDWTPLSTTSLPLRIHLATIIPAFLLGTWLILASRKGSRPHRSLGFLYLTLMTVTATAAIFIRELNPGGFSFFHLFVPLTYYSVFAALWSLRRRNIPAHKRAMLGLYIGGLLFAGALTFAPGRLMHRLFFG